MAPPFLWRLDTNLVKVHGLLSRNFEALDIGSNEIVPPAVIERNPGSILDQDLFSLLIQSDASIGVLPTAPPVPADKRVGVEASGASVPSTQSRSGSVV